MFISIRQRRIDVSIPFLESNFHSIANFVGLALPGAKANGWDLVAGIEGKGFSILLRQIQSRFRWNDGRSERGERTYEVIFEAGMVVVKLDVVFEMSSVEKEMCL